MKRAILEYIERALSVALSTFTCLGMFLVGNLIWNLTSDTTLSNSGMIAVFLGSVILTYLLRNLWVDVFIAKLEITASEMELEQENKYCETSAEMEDESMEVEQ